MLNEPFCVGERLFTEQDIELIQTTVRRFVVWYSSEGAKGSR